jgi:hypothetical protein
MNQLSAYSSVFFSLCLALGCGGSTSGSADDDGSGGHGVGGNQAAGGLTGVGGLSGTEGGSSNGGSAPTPTTQVGGTEWKYATTDDGVFPKDRVLDIQVNMDEAAWTRLIATAKQEVWSTADVSIDGQSLGTIGIRPKGEYSLDSCVDNRGQLICDKLSLKLKFNEVAPDKRFYGLKRLALNQILDGAAVFNETLSYHIFNRFGIAAPRTSYATVTVNGESLGLYTAVEMVDGRFTDTHFENGDGNLYKEAWPDRLDEDYFASALETNEETATHEGLLAFASDMLAASDAELPQTLAKYMNLDKMLDYMAVDYAIANWDGITTFYAGDWGHHNHNFYLYQDEGSARFTLIPWDVNATFFLEHWLGDIKPWDALDADCDAWVLTAESTDLYTIPASCDPTIRALALSKDGYHRSVKRLLDEVFVVEPLTKQVDAYLSQVATAMQNDPFVSASQVRGSAQYIKGQIAILRTRLEAVLTAPTQVN